MLAQPSPVVVALVATAYATLQDGRRLQVLAQIPAGPDHPELYELGARLCDDGAWELEQVIADTVQLELCAGGAL